MTLPKHIQDGLDKAKEMQEELAKKKAGETISPEEDEPDKEEPEEEETQSEEEKEEPEPKQEPPEPEVEKKVVDKESTVEHWKQKYNTLRGMYDADVPRYTAQIREYKKELKELQDQVAELKASTKKVDDQPEFGDINPNDFEEYGDDMKKLVQQVSSLMKTVNNLKEENSQLKEQVTTVHKTSDRTTYQTFLNEVKKQVPQFTEQDADPDFLSWVSRMGIDLQKIANERDVERAVEVYNGYATLFNKYQQEPEVEPEPKPVEKPRVDKKEVEKQVAPPRSRTGEVTQNKKKQWTRDEITKVYDDIKQGVYSEKDAYRLKQKIFLAQREGRISP